MSEQQKTVQSTAQKTADGVVHKTVDSTVHRVGSVAQGVGKWLWRHRDHVAHWALVVGGVVVMVSGANKLVFGRVFPK